MQPDEFADVVVGVVKAALAPLQERLATAEQCNRDLQTRVSELLGLRDRLVVVETKAAMPAPVLTPVEVPAPVDLAPVLERIADLKDRMLVVETKATIPPSPDAAIMELRGSVEALQRMTLPAAKELITDALQRIVSLERRVQDDSLAKELGSLRERVAVVEVRPPVPGPPGEPGPPGKDGLNGKDGAAGLSWEGVYQDGKRYEFGQLVTWAGSAWHCNEPTTTKPGDGSKAWTLMVKKGRDGRDGKDAQGALPVVSVGTAVRTA